MTAWVWPSWTEAPGKCLPFGSAVKRFGGSLVFHKEVCWLFECWLREGFWGRGGQVLGRLALVPVGRRVWVPKSWNQCDKSVHLWSPFQRTLSRQPIENNVGRSIVVHDDTSVFSLELDYITLSAIMLHSLSTFGLWINWKGHLVYLLMSFKTCNLVSQLLQHLSYHLTQSVPSFHRVPALFKMHDWKIDKMTKNKVWLLAFYFIYIHYDRQLQHVTLQTNR